MDAPPLAPLILYEVRCTCAKRVGLPTIFPLGDHLTTKVSCSCSKLTMPERSPPEPTVESSKSTPSWNGKLLPLRVGRRFGFAVCISRRRLGRRSCHCLRLPRTRSGRATRNRHKLPQVPQTAPSANAKAPCHRLLPHHPDKSGSYNQNPTWETLMLGH